MDADASRHPTDQALNAYGLGKLAEAAAGAVHAHLEACPACRVRVAELSSDSFLARLRDARGAPAAAGSGPGATQPHRPGAAGAAAPPQAGTLPPDLADHPDYEVRRELGRGGMGVVYLAHNRLMGRDEVLKVVSKHLIERRGVLDRFTREIRSAARLHHPNIVTAYAAFRSGESIVFAMEYVEGLDLAKMVKSRGPLPVANAAYYAHQVALGLQHAHERGMVHRDIKPGNLMLARRGDKATVKVLDFGLAKATREDPVDGGLTHQGQMLGTPDFIAPEQISDAQSADIRADIYSLGCTAYYLLSGGPPFRGVSLYDLLQAHHSMDARPLNLARTDVPVELAALVAKMMAKEPHRRFQEPAEVAEALKPFFKPGKSAAGVVRPEPAQASPSQAVTEPSRANSTPTQPATAPPSAAQPAAPRPEAMWDSLVDLREAGRSKDAMPARVEPRRQRPPWVWPALAASVLLCGFVATWAAWVLTVKTQNGVIVLEDLPERAEVLVDGEMVTVNLPEGGGPVEIAVPAGRHKIRVQKDRFSVFIDEVSVATGEKKEIHVRPKPDAGRRPRNDAARALEGETPGPFARNTQQIKYTKIFENGVLYDEWSILNDANCGSWKVDGDLIVSSPFCDNLFHVSKRLNDFVMKAEVQLGEDSKAYFIFRSDWRGLERGDNRPRGYSVGLGGDHAMAEPGSIYKYSYKSYDVNMINKSNNSNTHFNKWITVEVTVVGSHFIARVGESTVEATDHSNSYKEGFIGFVANGKSRVKIRKIEIKDIGQASNPAAGGTGGSPTGAVDRPAQALMGKPPVPPADVEKLVTNSLGMKLVLIPAGEFLMGSDDSDKDAYDFEKPRHRVRISRPFSLGVHEVTRGQFRRFVESGIYRTEAEREGKGSYGFNEEKKIWEHAPKYTWRDTGFTQGEDHPVVNVSWDDAVSFCAWLGRIEGRTYRLPTEAEWEYACRWGMTTRFWVGDDAESLAGVGNVADGTAKAKYPEWTEAMAARDGFVFTAPVGRLRPNPFGLFDMHGNVYEWCSDGHDTAYYQRSPEADPSGPREAQFREYRGGGWFLGPRFARSAVRRWAGPDYRTSDLGFRVVRDEPGRSAGGTGGSPPISVDRPAQAPVGEPPGPPAAVPSGSVDLSKERGRGGFASLFNGKDLTGWVADGHDGSGWAVEGNAIVARGENAKSRDYLLSTREFADFILRLEFSLEPGSSSGVPLRAATDDNILLWDGVHHAPLSRCCLCGTTRLPRGSCA